MALEAKQAPIQWASVGEALFRELKRPGHVADDELPCCTAVKITWKCTSNPPYVFVALGLLSKELSYFQAVGGNARGVDRKSVSTDRAMICRQKRNLVTGDAEPGCGPPGDAGRQEALC
jgi:hypothetical protein